MFRLTCIGILSLFLSLSWGKVEETDSCYDGNYYDKQKRECVACLLCDKGFQPNEVCSRYATGSKCVECPRQTFSDKESWVQCKPHQLCEDMDRVVHARGTSVKDDECGACKAGFTEMKADMCWSCEIVQNPPRECDGHIPTQKPSGSDSQLTTTSASGGDSADAKDSGTSGPEKKDSSNTIGLDPHVLAIVLIVIAVLVLILVLVIASLLTVKLWPSVASTPVCACFRNFSATRKHYQPPAEGATSKKNEEQVVLPEIVVAQNPGRIMYGRQLSDTIVQLKLFELQPQDIVSSATDTTSDEDLLQLLSAKTPVDQIKWRVHMISRVFKSETTWSMAPELKDKLVGLFLLLDQAAQIQLGRALVDIFQVEVSGRIKMEELVRAVLRQPDTTVYGLVCCVYQHCLDPRMIEALCDELFDSRNKASAKPAVSTISESPA